MPRFLSVEAALFVHREQIEAHGGAHGLRDQNGLESALGALKREQLAERLRRHSRKKPKEKR